MSSRRRLGHSALVTAAVLGLGACSSFERARVEFDSLTRRDKGADEPDRIEYRLSPYRYSTLQTLADWVGPWLVDLLFDIAPEKVDQHTPTPQSAPERTEQQKASAPETLPNPAGSAREWLQCLVAKSEGSRYRTALAANRTLWLLAYDGYPATLVACVDALESLLRRVAIDPSVVPPAPRGSSDPEEVAARAREEARVRELFALVAASWPGARKTELSSEQLVQYANALADLTRLPLRSRKAQRNLVRDLFEAERNEPDPKLRQMTAEAADRALAFALVTGLRDALFAELPIVREQATLAFFRLGGPRMLPVLLSWITRPRSEAAAPAFRYDREMQNRRTLIRLAGQSPAAFAAVSGGAGPTPLEFLYDVVRADLPELRPLALEALAQVLGRPQYFTPETLDDRTWADSWWREHVLGGERSR